MPILFTQKSPIMGIWKITETWQDMSESFKDNESYFRDVSKIQSDKRKQEWLAVRLLLKHLYGPELHIDYHENGAPVLRNSLYNISISHTKGFAAVILSKHKNPGIDIEYHSDRAWRLREKYLGENELEMFDLKPGSSHNNPLADNMAYNSDSDLYVLAKLSTLYWCAKETAFKALQQTEVDFINHLHILPFTLSDRGTLFLKETKTTDQQVFNINYLITEDYIITWKE